MFASKDLFFTRPSGYQISRSVRLRSGASAYFNRTFGTPTSGNIFTWSSWVKRGAISAVQPLFNPSLVAGEGASFNASNQLTVAVNGSFLLVSTPVYRDPSAWYHIVLVSDMGNATAALRFRVYVNGAEVTAWATDARVSYTSFPYWNKNAVVHYIGYSNAYPAYADGYMAETNFIDGQALTPSSFGQYNANGVWSPIKYAGTYGTNGFYLNFSDNSGVTATTIGKDYSGNGNNWTPNNISVTAGVTYDSMLDSPTLSAASSNYAVMNPLWQGRTNAPTNGNLDYPASSVGIGTMDVSLFSSYWEITSTGGTTTTSVYSTSAATTVGVTTGLTYGFRFNSSTGALDYTTNGSSFTSLATGLTSGPYFVYVFTAASTTASFNGGQRPFTYTPPTGYVALNTQNLSTPTIANGAAYMAATLYTGNGTSQNVNNSVNGVSFQPDWAWFKSRNNAASHAVFDSVRGANQGLYPNLTNAEGTWSGQAFLSNGFTVNATYSGEDNTNGNTMVGWQWKAGGTAVSNTSGSITSSVSVGATQGFSVVTYTGTGANATVGHGLGVAPKMVITKNRGATSDWAVWHTSLTSGAYYLLLDTTAAQASGATYWNSTVPTSSVFSVGTATPTNVSTNTYVAYCFSEVAGFSKFGSYTGNGSADGPFVYTNFQPRWVMVKRTDSTSDWYIWDTSRDTYNVEAATLLADTAGAETSATSIDGLSNGFKCRSATVVNASGGTYIYAAFASSPFKLSLAR